MKKSIVLLSALCALIMLFSACSVGFAESKEEAVQTKQAADINQVNDNTFLLGDADGDGNITILDATLLQQVLCELVRDDDGKISQRGNINGGDLDISDVTLLMRYFAEFDDDLGIGQPINANASTQSAEQTTNTPKTEPEQTSQSSAGQAETQQSPSTANQTEPIETQHPTNAPTDPQQDQTQTPIEDITLGENDLPFDIL